MTIHIDRQLEYQRRIDYCYKRIKKDGIKRKSWGDGIKFYISGKKHG